MASGENIELLLGRCAGLKKREAEEVVVEIAPRKALDGSVRKKPGGQDDKQAQPDILALCPCSSPSAPSPSRPAAAPPAQVAPATPELYNFRFAAPGSFKDGLVRLGEILGIPNPLENAAAQPRPHDVPAPAAPLPPRPSRHVPVAIRDRVFSRANHRCQYVAADGTRCPCRTGLQVEQREPFAVSHSHAEDHLEALCAPHTGSGPGSTSEANEFTK